MTGDQYVNLVLKRLLGVTSFKQRLLEYLQGGIVDFAAKVYTLNGTFGSSKVSFGLTVANKFDLDADVDGTDGDGHLMKTGIDYEQGVQFANENTIDYYVGLKYAERPASVQVNPRTGYPEYEAWEEVIGERGEPDSVSDEGGYLRFTINTIAGGVNESASGRKALVWKKSPAPAATSDAIAIQLCNVSDIGGVPTGSAIFDTADYMGQTTPSTTASDYEVILLGPRVSRYTDLSATAGYWYIGTVTGAGLGNPPSGSDISGQRLIEHSLSDVLAYNGGPAWKDGTTNPATTIEAQLDKLVTDLVDDTGVTGPNASGAHKIGAAAQAGSPDSLSVGSIGAQLLELLTAINARGRLASDETWTGKQTFSGNGTNAPLLVTPKSVALAADGEAGLDTAGGYDTLSMRIQGVDRCLQEGQQGRSFWYPIECGEPEQNDSGSPYDRKWAFNCGTTQFNWRTVLGIVNGDICFPLNRFVPAYSFLQRVRVWVKPGTAHSSPNGMIMWLYERPEPIGTPASFVGPVYDDGTINTQYLEAGPALNKMMSTPANTYWILIRGGNTSTTRDYIYCIEIDYTDPSKYMRLP